MATIYSRSLVMDTPVNPAILSGLVMISRSLILTGGPVLTVTFPAKTIISILQNFTGTSVAVTRTIANDIATVTFTPTGDGTLDYMILASVTEVITTNAAYSSSGSVGSGEITSNETDNPKG